MEIAIILILIELRIVMFANLKECFQYAQQNKVIS
jgi:hypothetical protein